MLRHNTFPQIIEAIRAHIHWRKAYEGKLHDIPLSQLPLMAVEELPLAPPIDYQNVPQIDVFYGVPQEWWI